MKRLILGFARNRADIIRKIVEHSDELIEHLVKVKLYPDDDSFDHWCTEVRAQLCYVPKLSGSNKYPSEKLIYTKAWGDIQDVFTNYVDCVIDDYGMPNRLRYREVYQFVDNYMVWLSRTLSTKGDVSMAEVQRKLDELLS